MKSSIFIISGPSGAGEDSIIRGLEKYFPIARVITTSTRQMRLGETQGHPYWFISHEEFIKRRDNHEFVEWAEQYNSQLYGVTKEEIERVRNSGKVGTWKIDYQGVMSAKRLFPEIPAIFINAPLDILEQRIRRRDNVSDEYIKERMDYTREWLKHKGIYDYEVMNEESKLDVAIAQVVKIIEKHL